MKTVYLALGSNVGDRETNLRSACGHLEAAGIIVECASSIYETEPRDVLDQHWFLNQVLEARTVLFPRQLLAKIRGIERGMGRKRTIAKGPRVIDIDILFYGESVVTAPELQVPHPRIAERRFVLEPLAEIAPELRHPVTKETVREMLGRVTDQVVRKVGR